MAQDELCTPEHVDASFCRGPSDGCELEQRSARGYCPGEEPGHEEERQTLEHRWGPPQEKIDECAAQGLWPEWEPPHECTQEALDFERDLNAPQETTQQSVHSEPAQETLPHTGPVVDLMGLSLMGVALITAGRLLLRKSAY